MSRGEILFRNQSGKRYMTKTVIGKPKSVHESLEDTLYDDIDDEDENIALKIKQAVAKLNSIRRACKEIDPDYDEISSSLCSSFCFHDLITQFQVV